MPFTFDWTVRIADICIAAAALIGPIAAVQAQKWLERRRERRVRQARVFQTLMATRASTLSGAHVEAINAVPIEFHGGNRALKGIVNAWKAYIDHLGNSNFPRDQWATKRIDLLVELLSLMGKHLGYDFNTVELSREIYSPVGHATMETEQESIRRGFAKIFSGEAALPLSVKEMPMDKEMRDLIVAWLTKQSQAGKA